jgi:hypothetical protein
MFRGSNHWSHHTAQGNDPGIPLPTSFASWVIGVLTRDRYPWFMEYVESSVFKKNRDRLKLRTGIDAQWLIVACIAIHSSAHHISKMMSDLLEQVKAQTTSSITIDNGDSALRTGILRYIRTAAAPAMEEEENFNAPSSNVGTSWPSLHGQHDLRDSEGGLQPLPGSLQPFFWYENTLLMPDLATDQPTNDWDRPARYAQPDHMTLR